MENHVQLPEGTIFLRPYGHLKFWYRPAAITIRNESIWMHMGRTYDWNASW